MRRHLVYRLISCAIILSIFCSVAMPAHASSTVYEVSFATQEEIGTVKYNNEDYKLLRVKISSQYTEFLMKEKTGKIGTADFPQAAYTIDFSSVKLKPG